jgi:tetratricopeptide (TPR) repeat protein
MLTAPRALLVAVALAAVPLAASAGVSEQWYLLRGRSNMKIKNYRAAIEAFQKACELDPASREASRSLVLAYERNGETDRAIAQLDSYLARFGDDPEMAFKQARWLGWSRYAYRRGDAIRYYRMGLRSQDDASRRRELARLLARDKATLDEALGEYRTLLAAAADDGALRAEYHELLLWDPRHRPEAITELTRDADAHPEDGARALAVARLLADEPGREGEAAERYRGALARRDDARVELELARVLARAHRRAEALVAYGRAVELRPRDVGVRLERARVLAGERARRPEALAEYRRVLEARPKDLGLRLEYARLLAADESGREAALGEVARLAREAPDSREVRLTYARLLGARRDTSEAAIAQYEREAEVRPESTEAHAGLARAYAWNGDADRALWHADRALAREPAQPEVSRLRADLGRGREPWLGGVARALSSQSGGKDLLGVQGGLRASRELTPFARGTLEGGAESFAGEDRSADGARFALEVEGRPSTEARLEAALAYDGVRGGAAALTGRLGYTHGTPEERLGLFAERRARLDSFTAFAGDASGRLGLASENVVGATVAFLAGALRIELRPEAGAVTHAVSPANGYLGGTATVALPLAAGGAWRLAAALESRGAHYAEDRSATSGDARPSDGYFSPSLFLSETARAVLVGEAPLRWRFELALGPALQLVEGAPGDGVHAGGDARVALWWRAGDRVWWSVSASGERVGTSYTRFGGETALAAYF